MTKLISELGYKSAQGCEMARYSLHFLFIGRNGHLKLLVNWGISMFGPSRSATRGKVVLMCMVRWLNVQLGWACRLVMALVKIGLLRRGVMVLRVTPLNHLSSQLLVFIVQLFDLLEQWLHTTIIFFLLSFYFGLPSLEVVNHNGWLGCIRCIGHCASMFFVSFP